MTISLELVQILMGGLFILVPSLVLFFFIRRRSAVFLAIILTSVVLLTGLTGFGLFKNIYPPIERGDDIYDDEGTLIRGYYNSLDEFARATDYEEAGEAHRLKLDEKFELYNKEYDEHFLDYSNDEHSRFVNCLMGLGIGGVIVGIVLVVFTLHSRTNRRVRDEMDLRDIFS